MTSGELKQAEDLLKAFRFMLHLLQKERKFPSYGLHFNVKTIADSQAIEWHFYTWVSSESYQFEWKRLYPYNGIGRPLHELQIISWELFQEDMNSLVLEVIGKYPQVAEMVRNLAVKN